MKVTSEQLIFDDLCWLLECQMATQEYLRGRSRSSKCELRRHENIIRRGLERVAVYAKTLTVPKTCPRVWCATRPNAVTAGTAVVGDVLVPDGATCAGTVDRIDEAGLMHIRMDDGTVRMVGLATKPESGPEPESGCLRDCLLVLRSNGSSYVRRGIEKVDLGDQTTLPGAVAAAVVKGYRPTRWTDGEPEYLTHEVPLPLHHLYDPERARVLLRRG